MQKKFSLDEIRKIVVLGDSVTYGLGAGSREKCWVERLKTALQEFCPHRLEVVNRGISSNILCVDTPAYAYAEKPAGLERLQQDVIAEQADLVIIAYGLNDARGGTSPRVFRRDYQTMIDRIREQSDPVIVLVNSYYMHECFYHGCENWDHSDYDVTEEFNLIIRQLAEKNGLILADVYAAQCGVDRAVCEDHCHPSDLGHFLIANRVAEAIVRAAE